jgi:hypothetical protein
VLDGEADQVEYHEQHRSGKAPERTDQDGGKIDLDIRGSGKREDIEEIEEKECYQPYDSINDQDSRFLERVVEHDCHPDGHKNEKQRFNHLTYQ